MLEAKKGVSRVRSVRPERCITVEEYVRGVRGLEEGVAALEA